MNEFTHFMTGYLVARGLKYKEDRFECFFTACCAALPDIDSTINIFVPFEHGVWTHTYVIGMLFVIAFAGIAYLFTKPLLYKTSVTFGKLIYLGFFGLSAHFLLDVFTFHEGPCSPWLNPALMPASCSCIGSECFSVDDRHHLYFWPLWNFPPHLNTVLPFSWVTYDVRVWIEVIYSVILGVYLIYLFVIKHQNIFGMFLPNHWWKYTQADSVPNSNQNTIHVEKTPSRLYIWLFFLAFVVLFQYVGGEYASAIRYQANPWIASQIAFYGLFIIANWGLGLYALFKAREFQSTSKILSAIGIVFVFLGIGRFFLMQFDYFEGSYNISYRVGCFFDLLAFTLLDYVIEKYLYQKTRFLFTIYGIIISSFQILAMADIFTQPIDIADYLHMYGLFPLLLLPFLLYIYVFRKSTGELRKHAILIILGMLIYLVAQVGFSLLNTIGLLEELLQKNLKASLSIIGALLCGGFLIANSSSKTMS